jgi:sugar lactone lactonase YvrE
MKLKINSSIRAAFHSIGVAVCAGTVLLIASCVSAQNLFEADYGSGNIYEFTPGGAKSTFASGLGYPEAVAFNNAGDLFVSNEGKLALGFGYIAKITPDGTQSIVASGLIYPHKLAFDKAGNLFVATEGTNSIIEITPDGVMSTFASGWRRTL